jgi:hypothetical protein
MIATLSKRGGRRYPSLGGAFRPLWMPSLGTTVAPPVVGAVTNDRTTGIPFESRRTLVPDESRTAVVPSEPRRVNVR